MSQFGYCVSNQTYNDAGQMEGCGDTYQSLSGMDNCALAGIQEYQQGLMASTPSYCNQSSEYAPVRGMYSATQVPAIARLQYHAPITQLYDNTYVNPLMTVQGGTVPVKAGAMNEAVAAYQAYAQEAVQKGNQATIAAMQAQQAQDKAAKIKEAFFFEVNPSKAVSQARDCEFIKSKGGKC